MKNSVESAKMLKTKVSKFSMFSGEEILSNKAMSKILGGDGGQNLVTDPPKRP